MQRFLFLFFIASTLLGCEAKCDDVLTIFTVKITDTAGQAVYIDSTVTTTLNGNTINSYRRDTATKDTFNRYSVLRSDDLTQSQDIKFKAFRKDSLIVEAELYALADKCGVKELLGNIDITVE